MVLYKTQIKTLFDNSEACKELMKMVVVLWGAGAVKLGANRKIADQ